MNQPNDIAFNPLNNELYVTNGGDASISAYQDSSGTSTFARDTAAKFTPPSGQTNPMGIAIVP